MKTNHLLRKFAVVAICLAMTFGAKAQTTATTFAQLQSQFAAAVASGVPSTINIGAAIVVNYDFSMVSTGDTVTINMVPFGISVTSGTLTIGNKVKITSADATAGAVQAAAGGTVVINAGCYIAPTTGNTVQALAGGTVIVNGGKISSTATAPVVAAGGNVTINGGTINTSNYPAVLAGMYISSAQTGGTVTINGGYIATTMNSGNPRGAAIDFNGIMIVNGGEIHGDKAAGGRGISVNSSANSSGGKLYVNGGTITALGATGRAIQLDNANIANLWITGSPTITGGLEALIAQKNGIGVISGTPTMTGVIGTNASVTTGKVYDCRNITAITATPGTGYYAASQSVTLGGAVGNITKYSGTTNAQTTVTATMVYTTDGTTPLVASPSANPVTVSIPTVLTVAPLIDATTIGSPTAFAYYPTGAPATAAPTPPAYAAPKVISIFSDAFTNVAGTDFNPGWGQSGAGKVFLSAGGNVLRLSNLNYQGTAFGSPVNALPMNYLHLDLYTTDETLLQVFCISAATGEKFYQLPTINLNAWNSYDIPLTAFTSQGLGISDLIQFKFVGSGNGVGISKKTVYLDNLYFYNSDPTPDTTPPTAFTATAGAIAPDAVTLLLNGTDNSGAVYYEITYGTTTLKTSGISGVQKSYQVSPLTGSTAYNFSVVCKDATGNVAANSPIIVAATTLPPLPGAPVPTADAAKVISVFSDTYTPIVNNVSYFPNWGQTTIGSLVLMSGNNTLKYVKMNYQGIDLNATIDMSAMNKLHVDVYSPDGTALSIQPICTPAATKIMLPRITLNKWISFDISLSAFANINKATIHQFMFNDGAGKTFYIDNLYLFNDAATSVANVSSTTVKCYPSQVIDRLNVKADTEISQVTVRNLLGQSVKSIAINSNEQSIDLSAVSAGNYFVTVKLANGQSATQKIIKL